MSRPKGRLGLLFLGIFIGILAGVLLAFWLNKIDWDITRITGYFTKEKETEPVSQNIQVSAVDTSAVITKNQYNKFVVRKTDTLTIDTSGLSYEEFAELYKDQLPDSLIEEAYRLANKENGNEVVVAKDELLFTKHAEVAGLPQDKGADLDSILLDDRGSKKQNKHIVQIEFWKSPINYRGYKWDKRKLVLFGFYEFDYARLKYFEGVYYLQYGTLFYHLEQTNSFLNLSPVTESELVRQLNNL
jgi:hypothetical protein